MKYIKKILKVVHPCYIISFVLLVEFVIIPFFYLMSNSSGSLNTCNNICPNGEVERFTDGNCICSDGTIINPDDWWDSPNNNESE